MSWDGKTERRTMSRDWIERDRLLSEIHANTRDLPKKLEDHQAWDNKRFFILYVLIVVMAAAGGFLSEVLGIITGGM